MKTNTLRIISIVTGIFFLLLGIAHLFIAVPMGIEAVKLIPSEASAPLTMSNVVTAAAVFMCGLLVLYSIKGIKNSEKWGWVCSAGSGVFMTFIGIGYVVIGPDNPFAYVALIAALAELIPIMISRKLFK